MDLEKLPEVANEKPESILDFFELVEALLEGDDKENFRKIKNAYSDYLRSAS